MPSKSRSQAWRIEACLGRLARQVDRLSEL